MQPLSRLAGGWRRLWGSVAFRLTFNYSLLAVVTTIVVLLFVYIQLVNLLQTEVARQAGLDAHRLVLQHQNDDPSALLATVRALLSDHADSDIEMYLLLDEDGEKLAGNIDAFDADPTYLEKRAGTAIHVTRDGRPDQGFLRAIALPNGWTLVVGRDIYELQQIKQLISQAMLATMFIAIVLVMAGTYIFRVALMWRVQDIRDTARRVGTGELTRRVPGGGETDEFAGLRDDINQMLDRIEALMSGVRNVSDSLAHNIRTPLMRVLGRLDAAQAALDKPASAAQAISAARNEISDMLAVAGKLLLIAETESGVRRQTFKPVRLDQIADDVVDLFDALAAERGNTLVHQRDGQPHSGGDGAVTPGGGTMQGAPVVLADADLLAGVIVNLVENAFKYAGDGAKICIRSGRQGQIARLIVEDNGPGVSARHLAQLGTRFYRLAPDAPGFGLGLASVKAIVSLHEGRVFFGDAAPGLRVRIELPLAAG